MKIAVAFFGIPRATQQCFPSIQKKILDTLPKDAEVKVFFHLYQQSMVINKRSKENGALTNEDYAPFLDFTGKLEAPEDCLETWDFEGIKESGDYWNDDFASLKNLIHQLNSLYEVTQMLKDYEPDVVLFIRPDLIYHDSFRNNCVRFSLKYPNSSFIPAWQWFRGLNDRFSICGKQSYEAYGERILNIKDYLSSVDNPLHSEDLLKFSLNKNNTLIMPLCIKASRVRIGGLIRKEKFSIFKKTGGFKSATSLIIKKYILLFF